MTLVLQPLYLRVAFKEAIKTSFSTRGCSTCHQNVEDCAFRYVLADEDNIIEYMNGWLTFCVPLQFSGGTLCCKSKEK